MNFYHLKSIISSSKTQFDLLHPVDSFFIAEEDSAPYIEPEFEKVLFESEQPSVLLISAVGATGKSALAKVLSAQTSLPLLDLAKHKPVGDNTLTGLLTNAYELRDISSILEGLSEGTYGIIIDGVDEGRSKTTGKGFEAFLDDIAKLAGESKKTTIIMLGRTQVLDDTWSYLEKKGVSVGLITISPFAMEGAKKYIDAFTGAAESNQIEQYRNTRDAIIEMLGSAFSQNTKEKAESFEAFIGYPPVLDAVVTLLSEERNYHKLLETTKGVDGERVEIGLLDRIVSYILLREREQKVLPNIVDQLVANADEKTKRECNEAAYLRQEQSARLVSYCLGEAIDLKVFSDPKLNEKYESQLITWLPEHPFIYGREFRNAVFEAACIATLVTSKNESLNKLALRYLESRKPSYHLVYMAEIVAENGYIPLQVLNSILLSAMEFRSVHSKVYMFVDGGNWQESHTERAEVGVEIEIQLGEREEQAKTFSFNTLASPNDQLTLGPRLAGAFISVPCSAHMWAPQEFEITAPVEVEAKHISIDASALSIRASYDKNASNDVIFSCSDFSCGVDSIVTGGADFSIAVDNKAGIVYPAINYVEKRSAISLDPNVMEKYFRLRRILLEFRSHSKGSLAKYRHKIEHKRVVKNELGRSVLSKLVSDGVLYLKGNFYHINPDNLSSHLGISWQELRKGKISDALTSYLEAING